MGWASRRLLELEERGFGDVEGSICLEHLGDMHLKQRLSSEVTERQCLFCGRETPDAEEAFAVFGEDVMQDFMETFRHRYDRASDAVPWDSEEGGYLRPTISTHDAAAELVVRAFNPDVEELALDWVANAIAENEWILSGDSDQFSYQWMNFAEAVKYVSRFILIDRSEPERAGHDTLDKPPTSEGGTASSGRSRQRIDVADFLSNVHRYLSDEGGLLRELPAGTSFFRGRLCRSANQEDVPTRAKGLGPAPPDKTSANRMSPPGISLFYASSDPETAVAEIAGHGVEPFAAVGRFTSSRKLTILDLTARPTMPSPFDIERRKEALMLGFLEQFVSAITWPVIPDERQHVEYVPTQVLTEYLRLVPDPPIDGIRLPSSHTGNATYVMFCGPEAFADLEAEGHPVERHEQHRLADNLRQIAFTLDPHDVTLHEVTRRYEIAPHPILSGGASFTRITRASNESIE